MFLLSKSGISVLPFWGLSPRETPDLNHTSWTIPVSSITMITGLSASGGLYAIRGTRVIWIPVVQPYSLLPPFSLSDFNQEFLKNSTSILQSNLTFANSSNSSQVDGNFSQVNITKKEYPIYQIQGLNVTQLIWLGLDSTTLYMISSWNGTQMLYSILANGQNLTSPLVALMPIEGAVTAFIVHRKYLSLMPKLGRLIVILPLII